MSSDIPDLREQFDSLELGKNWYWYLIAGLIMIIGGILALTNPFAASMTVELVAGWTFIFAGIVFFIQAFSVSGTGAKFWVFTLGVLGILLGIALLYNPLAGLISLTFVTGILIGLSGIAKIVFGFKLRPLPGSIWLILSGVFSIIFSIVVLANIKDSALITLGLLLAIELISSGILLSMLSFSFKKLNIE